MLLSRSFCDGPIIRPLGFVEPCGGKKSSKKLKAVYQEKCDGQVSKYAQGKKEGKELCVSKTRQYRHTFCMCNNILHH